MGVGGGSLRWFPSGREGDDVGDRKGLIGWVRLTSEGANGNGKEAAMVVVVADLKKFHSSTQFVYKLSNKKN